MKKRSMEILQKLIEHPHQELTIHKLMEGWHKSEKTLRNDIQEILDYIKIIKLKSTIEFDGQTLKFIGHSSIHSMQDIFKQLNTYYYRMSLDERKIYIIVKLLYQQDYFAMQQLADDMCVTRNTIVDDCKNVDEYLKRHHIIFESKSKKGIKIVVDNQENITLLLIDIFNNLIPSLTFEKTFFPQLIINLTGFKYSLADVAFYMESYAKDNNMIFAKESFHYVAICIFVLINRMIQVPYAVKTNKQQKELQLDTVGLIVQYVMNKLDYKDITDDKIINIERIILARQLSPQIQSINDFELYGVICHFLLAISSEIDIDLKSDDLLIKSLISHIKSMHNWNDTDIDFDINEDYGVAEIFRLKKIAENKYQILEKYLQYSLNTNMKNSIIIHICAAILRNRQNMDPFNVIISCPGSMATSKYLEVQIKNYFNFNVVDTMTTKQIERAKGQFNNVDFIISTVKIPQCNLPVVVVSPWITIDDINKIQRLNIKKKQNEIEPWNAYPILAKLYSVYKSANSHKIAYLNENIELLLEKSNINSNSSPSPVLLDMLKLKYIYTSDQKLHWKLAMKKAAEELIKDGYFDQNYLTEAIDNVKEYGAYIIISHGVALAHAGKTSEVYRDGISLLVAKDGIFFDEGEQVNLLFFFSQKSDIEYLELFKELIKLGEAFSNIDKIKTAKTSKEVYQRIKEILHK